MAVNLKIEELIKKDMIVAIDGDISNDVNGVSCDSRTTKKNDIFFAISGFRDDGNVYINQAIESGAIAIVSEKKMQRVNENISFISVKNIREALAYASSAINGFPSNKMRVIGITGTNGKTTICYLLESIFKSANMTSGAITTVSVRYDDYFDSDPLNTTPESNKLQCYLADMERRGVKVAIMEATSHGLALKRLDYINFDAVLFTNLTHDHLDFHNDYENYFEAKRYLFKELLFNRSNKNEKFGIACVDDEYGVRLLQEFPNGVFGYSIKQNKNSSVWVSDFYSSIEGTKATISCFDKTVDISTELIGIHNLSNIVGVVALASKMGISHYDIANGIFALKKIPGRLERVENKRGVNIFVDYAHTPDGLKTVLINLLKVTSGRLILVMGCGGDRDKSKRREIGKIATDYADLTFFTTDNPRSEEPSKILEDIVKDIRDKKDKFFIIEDRKEAIIEALKVTGENETLLISGRGHERFQKIGNKRMEFDDCEVVREILGGLE